MKHIPDNEQSLYELLLCIKENNEIELKKSSSQLTKSFWETYSSFSNTNGGFIILGINEATPENEILGVENPQKMIADLWNLLANPNKVSFRTINNEDVRVEKVKNKFIIIIYVHEAPLTRKPVYLDNRWENAYIRTGDGDRKITKNEYGIFTRNASTGIDAIVAEHFTMDDLDEESMEEFKKKVSKRYPKRHYDEMDLTSFFLQIGGFIKNRDTKELQIKRGTILFLGKYASIRELYPHFHLDYFNKRGNNPRWSDRIATDEPQDREMNIYNFYIIVYEKLKSLLQESFRMDENQLRLPIGDFDDSIREGLVNCLAHADYAQGFPTTKIEAYDGYFDFLNPGTMLIPKEQFIIGGDSRIRNEVVMTFFRLLGASERQGNGGPLIYQTATKTKSRIPELNSDFEKTELMIWNVDLVDAYPELNLEEKNILQLIVKSIEPISTTEIQYSLGITQYSTRKYLKNLENKNLIEKIGNNRSTKYKVKEGSTEMVTQIQVLLNFFKNNLNT